MFEAVQNAPFSRSGPNEVDAGDSEVNACIRQRLKSCAYSHLLHRVTWCYRGGTLRLIGIVPSFYIKQVLQTLLRDIDFVERIVNEVHVVHAAGPGNVRSNEPAQDASADFQP